MGADEARNIWWRRAGGQLQGKKWKVHAHWRLAREQSKTCSQTAALSHLGSEKRSIAFIYWHMAVRGRCAVKACSKNQTRL